MTQHAAQSVAGGHAPALGPATHCAGCGTPLPGGQGRLQTDGRTFCEPCHHRRHRLRACAACGAMVSRQDCHRNRYGEYICRTCQSAGVKHTLRGTLNKRGKAWALRLLNAVIFAALGFLALRFIVNAVKQWDTPTAPSHTTQP